MKKTLTLLFILISAISYACTCYRSDIARNYRASSVIFYGKYIRTDTVQNYRDLSGQPYIVDNFEVMHFYKGVDNSNLEYFGGESRSYVISILNQCDNSCGICFDKDQTYLVYAYQDYYNGHLQTDGCTRTREISNNNYILSNDLDPDFGKDEKKELERLALADSKNILKKIEKAERFHVSVLNSQLEETLKQLGKMTTTLYIISISSVIIIIFLIYTIIKRRN